MRISQVTVTTKKGQKIEATSNENEQEIQAEKIPLEPWVNNTEGLDKEQTIEGMKQEIKSMKEHGGDGVNHGLTSCDSQIFPRSSK